MSVNNRLLLELENCVRNANREIINPEIPELNITTIKPVMELVARARANYLKTLLNMPESIVDDIPDSSQTLELAEARIAFEELVKASQALQTAIEKGYLDVSS